MHLEELNEIANKNTEQHFESSHSMTRSAKRREETRKQCFKPKEKIGNRFKCRWNGCHILLKRGDPQKKVLVFMMHEL